MSQTFAQLINGKSATVEFSTGSASTPSVAFSGDTNTGIYSPGADQVAISTNGTQRVTVDTAATTSTLPVVHPLGAVGTPSITFTGDLNTGFWSPAADTVAASTGGSERLRITSAGLVGVGTGSPSTNTEINAALDTGASLGLNEGQLSIGREANSGGAIRIGYDTTNNFGFISSGRVGVSWDKLILNAGGGNVGIGTSSPLLPLHVEATTDGPQTLAYLVNASTGGTNETAALAFALKGTGGTGVCRINAGKDSDFSTNPNIDSYLAFTTTLNDTESERLRITSAGNVGIGTTSPSVELDVRGEIKAGNGTVVPIVSYSSTNTIFGSSSGHPLAFVTSNTERARLDTSGRLLVGTSSSRTAISSSFPSLVQVETSAYSAYQAINNTNDPTGAWLALGKSRGTSAGGVTVVQINDELGYIGFVGADGTDVNSIAAAITAQVDGTPGNNDMPGRLVFSTTADGASSPTERMRINNAGTTLLGNTADTTGVLGTGLKVKSNEVGSSFNAAALCLQGTGGDFYAVKFADQDMGILSVTSGATDAIQIGGSATTATLFSNGLVQLPNVGTTASAANVFMNSAAGNQLARSTSSLRYKTDIEDLDTDRADAALSLRPVWYRSKATADRKDWSHYGLIAEEVAEIEPRLVNWTYLEDDYITVTNEYGIENKELKPDAELVPDGVQYDRLPVLLLSVVQRQEKRIKQLEAEIATLKAQ